MIPGRIIRISDKVTLRLWPKLEGKVITSTPLFSLKLKPMTVSPYYPNLHPGESAPAIQQVVITIPPLPKATKDDQEGYQHDDDGDDQEDYEDDEEEHDEDDEEEHDEDDDEEHDEDDDEEHDEDDDEENDEDDQEENDEDDGEENDEDDNDNEEDDISISSDSSEEQDDNSWECPHPTAGLEDIKDSDDSTAKVGWKRKRIGVKCIIFGSGIDGL